ncbi:hypothetical protein Sjap_001922 [Stephania japonica]|uniref:60S ribosomal export protein NMD3 n=1 Tax=Stephania japonica TaxID=461633 RepID=A0AAP0KN63_9MAGN
MGVERAIAILPYRRTFFYLEQVILKHDAAAPAIKIKLVDFIGKVAPIKIDHAKKLVSHDPESNNHNYKNTFSVEICPICREDLICLPSNAPDILDVEPVSSEINVGSSKYAIANFQVARMSDFGKNDNIFTVRAHLGHLLSPGDRALGYDLYGPNINDSELEKHKGLSIPNAILVKKSYNEEQRRRRGKNRQWRLESLNMEVDDIQRQS